MGLQTAEGITPSTLLSCPGATVDTVMVDWLHTMDHGVLADVIGIVLFAAPSPRKEQVKVLRNMIPLYYKKAWVLYRLDSLTEEMIKGQGEPPKQKGRAAQVRYLLPFCGQVGKKLCCHKFSFADSGNPCGLFVEVDHDEQTQSISCSRGWGEIKDNCAAVHRVGT